MIPRSAVGFRSVLNDNPFFGAPTNFSAATLNMDNGFPDDLDQGDKVAFASMAPYFYKDTSILEIGCGSRSDFVQALLSAGCDYTGFDVNEDALYHKALDLNLSGIEVNLIVGDALRDLGQFADDSFDIVLVQSMLLHTSLMESQQLLHEFRRISKKALFVIENSWTRIGNSENYRLFERMRQASDRLLISHGKTPNLDRIMPIVITKAFGDTPAEVFRIDERPLGDYSDELMPICETALECAKHCYEGGDVKFVKESIRNMIDYLMTPSVMFVPPAMVVAHIPKNH